MQSERNQRRAYSSTDVPAERTREEIGQLTARYGATKVACRLEGGEPRLLRGRRPARAVAEFDASGRHVRMAVPLSDPAEDFEQEERRAWRALFHSLKARFVAVADGVEEFDQAFLAHIVTDAGSVYDQVRASGLLKRL
jgi:hypothetical protein